MRRWRRFFIGTLAVAALAGVGCKKSSTGISLTIAPTSTTTLINNTVQFSPTETGSTAAITWSVTGGDTNGTISSAGLYTAPATVPTNPAVTINATISGTSTTTTATVTILSGVQVVINSPAPSTIGTGESFQFTATVTGVPASDSSAVTWTVSSGGGTVGASTGLYTATGTTATVATVTATSVFDVNAASTAVFTIVTAMDPTLISVGPQTGTRGAAFEDIYLTGTNFISTTIVLIKGTPVPQTDVAVSPVTCSTVDTTSGSSTTFVAPCTSSSQTAGSTILRVRVEDSFLASLLSSPFTNSVPLTFQVQRQGGNPQGCTLPGNPSLCTVVLTPQSPVIAGLNKSVLQLGGGGVFPFTIDGGFFGELNCGLPSPLVSAQFSGQSATAALSSVPGCGQQPSATFDLQLNISVAGSLATQPGLYQTSVLNNLTPAAYANLALQETYPSPPVASTTLTAGNKPWGVAINTATGLAVIANEMSNDVTFIDLTATPPAVVGSSLCTGGGTEPCATVTGPTGVAVDNIRNVALVTNSTNNTISVIDLAAKSVIFTVNPATAINNTSISQVPVAVGINPNSGTAVVAYRGSNFGVLLDLTPLDQMTRSIPLVKGIVTMGEGANPRVAVSTKLNWALVSPGGLGAMNIVNLGQQSSNTLQGAPMVSGTTITPTTTAVHTLSLGQPVLIQNVGLVTVTAVPSSTTFSYTQPSGQPLPAAGETISYSSPVAVFATDATVTGVAIDEETGQAVLADPSSGASQVSIFSLLDQSTTSVTTQSNQLPALGTIGAAINPLDDIAVVVNQTNSTGYVIDPTTPLVLNSFAVGSNPWDVAIDPGTNTAVVLNQGTPTLNVTIVPLGTLRTPQVLDVQTSCPTAPPQPSDVYVCGGAGEIFVPSTLTAPNVPGDTSPGVKLTIIGKGFDGSSKVFLDGAQFTPDSTPSDRVMIVTVPASALTAPHRYSLYVTNSSGGLSNVSYLRLIQSISVSSQCTSPQPTGVAIDAPNNLVLVTDSSCNVLYVLDGTTGIENGPGPLGLGANQNPIGVAVSAQGGTSTAGAGSGQGYVVAVANTGGHTVSLVDDVNVKLVATVNTDANPSGVAIDSSLGEVAVTDNGAATMDVFSTNATMSTTPVATGVGQGPVAIAIDPDLHIAAIGASIGNSVTFVPLISSSTFQATTLPIPLPLGIVYDPISTDFLISSSLSNVITAYNPTTGASNSIGVGINPTSMAYNYATGTLVTANSIGGNMTVVDFVSQLVREVFPMTSSGLFSVAINPQTNVVVVADSQNKRVLYVPVP